MQSPFRKPGIAASAAPVDKLKDTNTGVSGARMGTSWQERAEQYYDTVGEIWYATQFYGRIGKVRYFIEQLQADGDWQEIEDTNNAAWVEFDRIQDPTGGRTALVGTMGRLRFLIGEYALFVHFDWDEAGVMSETWEVLNPAELKVEFYADGKQRIVRGTGQKKKEWDVWETPWEPLPDQQPTAFFWRIWRRHPVRSQEADAPMRAVLDLCEELLLMRRAVRAKARSRIGAGILTLPREGFPGQAPQPGQAYDPMQNPVTRRIIESVITPLQDESSPESLVPLMLWLDAEYTDKIKLVRLGETGPYQEGKVREELVTAIARGLDLPPEVLEGMADVNHWGQWMIDDQMWKSHLQNVVQEITDDITSAVMRPRWAAIGLDPEQYRIGHDPKALIARPDETKDAKDVFQLGSLSRRDLLDKVGFGELNPPEDDELDLILQIIGKAPAADTGVAQDNTEAGPPPADGTTASGNGHHDMRWLNGALDMAKLRCHEVAGSRLRNLLRKHDATLCETHKDAANHDLAAALGRDLTIAVTRQPQPERTLVHGGTATLAAALTVFGLAPTAVHSICDSVEGQAARELYGRDGQHRAAEPAAH